MYKVTYRNIESKIPDLPQARAWLKSVADMDPEIDGHYEQQTLMGVEIVGYTESDDGVVSQYSLGKAVQHENS